MNFTTPHSLNDLQVAKDLTSIDPINVAIPFLFTALFFENVYFYMSGKRINIFDSISSLSTQALGLCVDWLYLLQENKIGGWFDSFFRDRQLEMGLLSSLVLIILVDLSYYWAHYTSHHVSILWSLHSPHHSSEEYNLTTSLRQGLFESLSNFFFFLPWCIFFPFRWIIYFRKINLIYQFFIHTECIEKLPSWVEYIFNTPSHHRVHHARNKIYCDKNFGGMFIIWDRLFGTYQEEVEKPVFGLVRPIDTFEPISVQAHHLKKIFNQVTTYPTLSLKLHSILSPPGFTYDEVTKKSFVIHPPEKIDTSIKKLDLKGNKLTNAFSITTFFIVFSTFFWLRNNTYLLPSVNIFFWQIVVASILSNIFLVAENKSYYSYYSFVFTLTLFTIYISEYLFISKTLLTCIYCFQFAFQIFVLYNILIIVNLLIFIPIIFLNIRFRSSKNERQISRKMQSYTRAEVRKHNRKDDNWIIVRNDVYDVTDYVKIHPGGEKSILKKAGRDNTKGFFQDYHPNLTYEFLQEFKIGYIVD